jgi:hypothetical protein
VIYCPVSKVWIVLRQCRNSRKGVKRCASAAHFCPAHDEVGTIPRRRPVCHRPAPLATHQRMRHHQFALV